jgi:1-deoxy-D-xylulose-5-phosphate reductoisomerase
MQKRIAVLGSTGSVGTNALRIIADQPDRFDVVLLTAHSSRAALCEQIARFRPDAACLAGDAGAGRPAELASNAGWSSGTADGILEMLEATSPDLVLNAITGAAGLRGSEWTLGNGKTLALANKESLVMAGGYLMDLATESGARILPVDSEHCAIFQCLEGSNQRGVRRIYLTASGGPFLDRAPETMTEITPDEALDHPTWDMGPRITIGSATMMNKAFEVLEAHWLFGLEPEQIEVVIHPQSIVHSMVEFVDGSMLVSRAHPVRVRPFRPGAVPRAQLPAGRFRALPGGAARVRDARQGRRLRGGAQCGR